MRVKSIKNVHVHANEYRVDDNHLDEFVPVYKCLSSTVAVQQEKVCDCWKQKKQLLTHKQREAYDDKGFGLGIQGPFEII